MNSFWVLIKTVKKLNKIEFASYSRNTPLITARTPHNDLEVSLTQIMWINVCIQTSVTLMPDHKHIINIHGRLTSSLRAIYFWFIDLVKFTDLVSLPYL